MFLRERRHVLVACCVGALGVFPVPAGGPVKYQGGDWIVTGAEVVEGSTVVLTGNLSIEPRGSLTLKRTTLVVESRPAQVYQILAKPGSALIISDSAIRPTQTDQQFTFVVQGARFQLERSRLEGVGMGGLTVRATDGAILDGNTISHAEFGVTLENSSRATITNNTITCLNPGRGTGAIRLNSSHYNSITGNRLHRQYSAVSLTRSWNNQVTNNEATLTEHTLGINIWHGSGNNVVADNRISAERADAPI